jgi:5'-3' exonuclease
MRHFLLIDGNSIGHMAQNMQPLSIGSMQVQAIYGFLRILRAYASKYSFATPIVLWDGMSWRKQVFAGYKEGRDKSETKHDIAKQQSNRAYHAQRPHIEKALSFLGVTQIKASNMEADDLAAILTNLYVGQGHKVHLVTEDQDWFQLVGAQVAVERPRSKDRISLANFEDVTGCNSPAMFLQKKALMGDSGDSVPGVGGVGEKRALEFVKTYGTFSNFLNSVSLEKSIDMTKLPKWQRDLVEDEAKAIAFNFGMMLMDLNTTARPKPVDMNVFKGEPSAANFRRFCDLLLFKSITDQFETWISIFPVAHQTAEASAA